MTSEFIPLELALRLKDLGFDKDCLAIYSNALVCYVKYKILMR